MADAELTLPRVISCWRARRGRSQIERSWRSAQHGDPHQHLDGAQQVELQPPQPRSPMAPASTLQRFGQNRRRRIDAPRRRCRKLLGGVERSGRPHDAIAVQHQCDRERQVKILVWLDRCGMARPCIGPLGMLCLHRLNPCAVRERAVGQRVQAAARPAARRQQFRFRKTSPKTPGLLGQGPSGDMSNKAVLRTATAVMRPTGTPRPGTITTVAAGLLARGS